MAGERDSAAPVPIRKEATRVLRVLEEDIPETQSTDDDMRLLPRLDTRLGRLESWVEVVMRTLAMLGLEALLTELDEARGTNYDAGES